MKKIIKVKIKRTVSNGGTHYDYPDEYNPKKVQVLCYESMLEKGERQRQVESRGNSDEYMIGIIDEEDLSDFLKSNDIVELTRVESEEFLSDSLEMTDVKITDPNRVMELTAKSARGETLTQEEKDALDPDKPEKGVGKSKSFKDVLDEYGV